MAERLQACLQQRVVLVLIEREALHHLPLLEERQLDETRQVRIADHCLGIAALRDGVEVVEEALADHGDAHVARTQILLGAIGDPALAHPGDEVLVHDVARDPATVLVLDRADPGRDRLLHERLAPLRHAHEEPGDAQRILVVDRHAPFEMIAEIEAVGPQRDPADGPVRIALVAVLAHALVDETVVEFLELELQVPARIGTGLAGQPQAPVVVHPFEMHGVAGVLLTLEPIARDLGEHDLAEAVLPVEWLPDRQLRCRQRPHIGPEQPHAFLHRIGARPATLLGARARIDEVVIRLLDAAPGLVHQPAVIVAANAALLDEAVAEIGAAMRTLPIEQPETAAEILIEHEILAHQTHGLDRVVVELARTADRHPIAPQQLSHRGPRPDLGQQPILFGTQHVSTSPSLVVIGEILFEFRYAATAIWRSRHAAGAGMRPNRWHRTEG